MSLSVSNMANARWCYISVFRILRQDRHLNISYSRVDFANEKIFLGSVAGWCCVWWHTKYWCDIIVMQQHTLYNRLTHYSFPLRPPGFQQMILQQHTRQWYDLLTILLTRWHGKVLKLCLLVDFLLKLLARISLVLSLEEEDHSQLQGDTTVSNRKQNQNAATFT